VLQHVYFFWFRKSAIEGVCLGLVGRNLSTGSPENDLRHAGTTAEQRPQPYEEDEDPNSYLWYPAPRNIRPIGMHCPLHQPRRSNLDMIRGNPIGTLFYL
jgi:hypothetical protein